MTTPPADSHGYSIVPGSHDGCEVLALAGELDLNAAPDLREAFLAALEDGRSSGPVLVDMTELQFLDSTIISVLLSAVQRAQQQDRQVRLVAVPPHVARILGVTGLEDVLRSYPDLDAAASAG